MKIRACWATRTRVHVQIRLHIKWISCLRTKVFYTFKTLSSTFVLVQHYLIPSKVPSKIDTSVLDTVRVHVLYVYLTKVPRTFVLPCVHVQQ
jgi:hypothetical protein